MSNLTISVTELQLTTLQKIYYLHIKR